MSYYDSVLGDIARGTDSSLIFFFILVCIVVVGSVVPIYRQGQRKKSSCCQYPSRYPQAPNNNNSCLYLLSL